VRGRSSSPNDFRAEKRDNVRTFGKKKTGDDFFGDGGTAEDMAPFQDDDLLPCFGEICSVDQAVVAAADDDNVVVLPHSVLSGMYPSSATARSTKRKKSCGKRRRAILLRPAIVHKSLGTAAVGSWPF